jgi:hypothetical protein
MFKIYGTFIFNVAQWLDYWSCGTCTGLEVKVSQVNLIIPSWFEVNVSWKYYKNVQDLLATTDSSSLGWWAHADLNSIDVFKFIDQTSRNTLLKVLIMLKISYKNVQDLLATTNSSSLGWWAHADLNSIDVFKFIDLNLIQHSSKSTNNVEDKLLECTRSISYYRPLFIGLLSIRGHGFKFNCYIQFHQSKPHAAPSKDSSKTSH